VRCRRSTYRTPFTLQLPLIASTPHRPPSRVRRDPLPSAPGFRYNAPSPVGHPAPKRGRAGQVTPVSPAGPASLSVASPPSGPSEKSVLADGRRQGWDKHGDQDMGFLARLFGKGDAVPQVQQVREGGQLREMSPEGE